MLQDDEIRKQNVDEESEIDLIEIFQKLWNGRRTIIKGCLVGVVIGLVIALSVPKEYLTTIKLSPEISDTKGKMGGNLGALASMAGINLSQGATVDAVYPDLYPQVVNSIPFIVDLFDVQVTTEAGKTMSLEDYIKNETSSVWWSSVTRLPGKAIGGILSIFRGKKDMQPDSCDVDPTHLSIRQWNMVNAIRGRISVNVDNKTSVISIAAKMQDPVVSAEIADTVAENLKHFIADYRTSKAVQDLHYAESLNEEARDEYYAAQQRYADYVDKNHNVTLNSRRIDEERLRNEVTLAFNLYNSTATLLQQARAKVQQDTPVYAVLQPATVPLQPATSRMKKLIMFAFLGILLTGAWVVFGPTVKESIAKIKGKSSKTEAKD